jgi:hypothetical protein
MGQPYSDTFRRGKKTKKKKKQRKSNKRRDEKEGVIGGEGVISVTLNSINAERGN